MDQQHPTAQLPDHLAATYPFDPAGVLEVGETEGVPWVLAKAPRYGVNGYVCVPEGHPWVEVGASPLGSESIGSGTSRVWGAATFCHGRWFGFDTQHVGDVWSDDFIWDASKREDVHLEMSIGLGELWSSAPKYHSMDSVREMVQAMAQDAADALA